MEDPTFLTQIASEMADRVEQQLLRRSQKDRQRAMLDSYGKVLQVRLDTNPDTVEAMEL